ncbi:hypothetical protein EST38_g13819 [Candolleomyces aberdarensis]|uniref:XPG-I domain-containing protein n=1 Tax=Candolleomyces aberdarensis TaxID=2316362 RepID=A0A4Q2CZ09_9AGAR|nr:hypothetical protein EST38_g13819 [Candolleomyces aberdarensis]
MGIPGLWKAIFPTCEETSLMQFAWREAMDRLQQGDRLPVVGIDATPWIFEAQNAILGKRKRGASLATTGKGAEQIIWLTRMEQLAELPIIPFVVLDGPGRPIEKRKTRAPGEADAELGHLSQAGVVDYVLTGDSDIFMFGTTKVIRSPQRSENRDLVEIYDVSNMKNRSSGLFSPAGFLFLAVVGGADYSGGLKECGFDTALQLAERRDLLDLLYYAAHASQERQAMAALKQWRKILRDELANNQSGLLNSRRPSAASNVTDDFPDLKTLRLYAKPLTTGSNIVPAVWDLFAIVRRFSSSVWTGTCLRELLKPTARIIKRYDGLGCQSIRTVNKLIFSGKPGASAEFPFFTIDIWVQSEITAALSAYMAEKNLDHPPSGILDLQSFRISLPASLIIQAAPGLVDEYCRENPRRHNQVQSITPLKIEHKPVIKEEVFDLTGPDGDVQTHYRIIKVGNTDQIEILD